MEKKPKIKVVKNGPFEVSGAVPLREQVITPDLQGHKMVMKVTREFPLQEEYALCRCGHTKTPPYCDGTHEHIHFHGTETASHDKYRDRAEMQQGADLDLYDDNRCAFARFCHRAGGSVWELVEASDDPRLEQQAVEAAMDCPSGRLVAIYRDGTPAEHDYQPAIALLQDPEKGVSAGLFVMGGIPLEGADGRMYEVQNRMALCRCGHSRNQPFCDAMHVPSEYEDCLEEAPGD